jgi:hypothetical protein
MEYKLFIDTEDDIICVGEGDNVQHILGIDPIELEWIETVECTADRDCDVCMHQALGKHLKGGSL